MKTLTLTDRRLIARKIINEVNEIIDLKNKGIVANLTSRGIIKSLNNDHIAQMLKLRVKLCDKIEDMNKHIDEIDEQYYDFLRSKDIPHNRYTSNTKNFFTVDRYVENMVEKNYLNKKVCLTKEDEIATELLLTNDKELNDVIASLKKSLLKNVTK
jgi:hypothetical protein